MGVKSRREKGMTNVRDMACLKHFKNVFNRKAIDSVTIKYTDRF